MRRVFSLAALAALVITGGIGTGEARAEGFKIDVSKLPDATKIHPSRLKIEVVNTNPEVSYHPNPRTGPTTLIIQMPQQQAPQGQTIIVPAPGSVPPSGGMTLDLSSPPPARFGTNIPAGFQGGLQAHPGNLPAGQIKVGRQSLVQTNAIAKPITRHSLIKKNTPVSASNPPAVLEYAPASTAGASSAAVKTVVTGKMQPPKRGELLKKN
ncbi:MAG: hypothetical protein IPM23_13815 [Candidatus Melainabacteria bacterium]|nr:hypothetical protein [Candidatus Melainabacteria bacterium]